MIYCKIDKKSFPSQKSSNNFALKNILIELQAGGLLGIVGESGSGKTTIARILCGYDLKFDGEVKIFNKLLHSFSRRDKAQTVQLIFQNPYKSLDPRWKIESSLLEIAKIHSLDLDETKQKIKELMSRFDLHPEILSHFPSELSGGQLQKSTLIRSLLTNPKFLVTDECLANLDIPIQLEIASVIRDLVNDNKLGVIFISHDLNIIQKICDQVMVLNQGQIAGFYPTIEALNKSQNPVTRGMLESQIKLTIH